MFWYRLVGEKLDKRVFWSVSKRSSFSVTHILSYSAKPKLYAFLVHACQLWNLMQKFWATAGTEESYSYFLRCFGQQQGPKRSAFTPILLFSWTETGNMRGKIGREKKGAVGSGQEDLAWEWRLLWFITGRGKLSVSSTFFRKDVMSCNNNLVTSTGLLE